MNFASALTLVRQRAPLVDCITNMVTVNDCANVLLAVGGSPTMASDPREVAQTAAAAAALVCNLGAIDKVESMLLGGQSANRAGRPVVFDPVARATPSCGGANPPGCWNKSALRSSGAMRRRSGRWPGTTRAAAGWT